MNRNQRRYNYKRPKSAEGKKKKNVLEEVLAPRSKRQMQSRCCYITPDQHSFVQLTSSDSPSQFQNLVAAEPNRPAPELNTIAEPIQSTQPKRPILPDMVTIANLKRPKQRTLAYVNKKPVPNRLIQPDVIPIVKPKSIRHQNTATEVFSTPEENCTEQYKSTLPDLTTAQLQELRKIFFPPRHKHEKTSQYVEPGFASYGGMIQCDSNGNAYEFDKVVLRGRDEETLTQYHNLPRNLHIAEIPRIKLIAVKFTKYKKDNIELRREEEKVVCVEYDVFDEEVDKTAPVQRMRAFFSITPVADDKAKELTEIPSTIKSKFNISTADLQKLCQKEIEVIDGKIIENQPYLNDLRKLLRRQENAQKNKTTLNLQALYDMGKRDLLEFDANLDINVMPKEELVEMQNIILQNCKSSVHGIRRRTLKNYSKVFDKIAQNTMSRSLVTELLRESNKNVAEF